MDILRRAYRRTLVSTNDGASEQAQGDDGQRVGADVRGKQRNR